MKPVVHDPRATRIGQEFTAISKEAASGHGVTKSYHAGTRIFHVQQFGPSSAESLDHRAQIRFRYVDHQFLVRLELFAVGSLARNDTGARYLKLVPFPSHCFHEDRAW